MFEPRTRAFFSYLSKNFKFKLQIGSLDPREGYNMQTIWQIWRQLTLKVVNAGTKVFPLVEVIFCNCKISFCWLIWLTKETNSFIKYILTMDSWHISMGNCVEKLSTTTQKFSVWYLKFALSTLSKSKGVLLYWILNCITLQRINPVNQITSG